MTTTPEILQTTLPDHTQLPESDGTFVSQSLAGVSPVVRTGTKNFQEHQLQQAELLLELECQQRELAQQRAERLAQKLRDMGVNPDE